MIEHVTKIPLRSYDNNADQNPPTHSFLFWGGGAARFVLPHSQLLQFFLLHI